MAETSPPKREISRISFEARNEWAEADGMKSVSTPETAWLLSQAFGTTPEFWLNLQANHDLAKSRPTRVVRKLRKAG